MSFADEYMALRAKRLAEIKETGKMQETPVEHTAPAGGGAVSDFGARYMALRQKRIADGYKTLTAPPDLGGRGPKAPFAIGSDPFGRKPVVEQIRKNDPQGEKYRAYYKTYNSGGADMLGLSQKISQDTKRIAELERELADDQYTLDNWPGAQPGHTPSKEMLDEQAVVWKRMERNRMELAGLRKESPEREEEYAAYWAFSFADMQNSDESNRKGYAIVGNNLRGDVGEVYRTLMYNEEPTRRDLEKSTVESVKINGNTLDMGKLARMTEEEKALFFYLCNMGETQKAEALLHEISGYLAQRYSDDIAEATDIPVLREAIALATSAGKGVKNIGYGFASMFADLDAPEISEGERMQTYWQEKHKGTLAGYTTGAASTIGNMMPAIAGYAVNPVVGSMATFFNTRGNAYAEAKRDGANHEQAWLYSTLTGAAETGLQTLLGRAGGLISGKIPGAAKDFVSKFASKISSKKFGRLMLDWVIDVGAEEIEENLQSFLDPAFKMFANISDHYEAPTWEEITETTIVTAISSTIFFGVNQRQESRNEKWQSEYTAQVKETMEAWEKLQTAPFYEASQALRRHFAENEDISPVEFRDILLKYGAENAPDSEATDPNWEQYEQEHEGERFQYDPTSEKVDQLEDMRGWREDTYEQAQSYTDRELTQAIEEKRAIRDDKAQDNKSRAIAQHHLDALEYTQMQRQNNNAALNEQRVEGVKYSGAEGLNDSGQRSAGVGAQGQTGGMAEGTGRSIPRGQGKTEKAIVEDIRGNAAAQSARGIGIIGGSESAELRVIPAERIDESESWSRIRDEVEAKGQKLVLVVGKMETVDPVKKKVYTHEGIRQVNADGTVTYYIKADKITRNAEQIYKHEDFHDIVDYNHQLLPSLVKALEDQYGKQELMSLIYSYVEAFDGVYGTFEEGMTAKAEHDLVMKYAEEIFADAYGEINRGRKNIENARQALQDQTDRVQRAAQNRKAMKQKAVPLSQKFAVDKYYNRKIDQWDEKDHGGAFRIGTVSEPLLQIGVPNKDIWFDQSKAAKQISEKQEINKKVLKEIPKLLEHPMVISESYDNTVLVFGELYDQNGSPIVVAVRINSTNRRNHITQINKIRSVGTRTHNLDNLLKDDSILYLNPNKKETKKWFNALGRSTPFGGTKFGLIRSISFQTEEVKQNFSVDDETRELDEDYARAMEEDGEPEGAPSEQQIGEQYDQLAKGRKEQNAKDAPLHTLKSRIASAERRIAILQETKKSLQGVSGLTAEVSRSLDSQIEKARETLKIDRTEWQKKWREHAAEEKKKAKEKKEKEIATQKARTAQKELKQDILNLFSVREGTRTELGDLIDKLSDRMLAQGHLSHEDRKNLFDALMDHGEKLSNPDEYFRNVRSFMTQGRIYVSEEVRAEFGDDWKAFQNRAWGNRIYLTSDETDVEIDVWTECLKTEFGGQFSGENDLKTQLEMIVDLAEEGKPERLTIAEMMQREMNEFGWSVEEQVEELEGKVDKLLEIFAQKADLEIRLRQQSLRQRMKDYDLYRTMQENKRQSAMENQARKNVMSAIQKLNKMRKRASPDQRAAIDEALKGIDVVARSISASGLEDLQELARLYDEQREAQGANFLSSPYVEARLERLGRKQIDDMDIEEVVELGRMVCSITNAIQNSNKLLASARKEDVYATARKAEAEIWNSEGSKDGRLRKLTLNHLDGKRFFGQISGWVNGVVERLGEALSTGQERQMRYQMNAMRIFDNFLSKEENQKFMKTASGKDAKWIKVRVPNGFKIQNHGILVETSEIEITPMMRISLLLHSKNEDNLRHIMNGGIRVPNREQYRKGNMKAAYDRGVLVKMDPATVRAIAKGCTEQEKAFARLCESYFNSMAKDYINEISMILDGFERAGGEHYYHIKTDPAFLAKQNDTVKRDLSVAATASVVNERVHASNPIVLQDATDALMEHIESISKYYGYAVPIRDLNAVLGQSFHGEENAFNGSVLETLKQKWGGSAEAYIDKLMADLQLPDSSKDYLSDFMVKLRGNYAKAVISANISSLLKQTTSYPVALPYLKMDGLIHGLAFKNMAQDIKTLEKYSAVYWYRNQGNSTAELSDVLKRREFGDALPWLFNATQKMDSWTTRRILAACEYRVQKDMGLMPGTQAEIDAGTDRYWSEVAKLFNDVVLKTQSNSTMMERPQITRANANNISRFLTMFRTDAYQQYNMLVEAVGRLRAAKKDFSNTENADNKKALSNARKFATRAVVGTLIGQIGCALVGVLLKKLRYDDEEFVDEEGQWDWGKVAGYIGGSVAEGYCGFITCGEWLYAAVEASLDKSKKWWDIDVSGLSVIDDVATAGINLVRALTSANLWEGKGAAKDFALALSKMAGIPAENMEKYLYMCLRWVAPEFVTIRENFWDEITKSDLSKESRKTIREAVSVLMDNRAEGLTDHDKDEIARLYMAGGVGAVPAGIPSSISYTNEDGEQIAVDLTTGQQKQFRELWSDIVSEEIGKILETDAYKEADDEGKTELIAKLYSYANALIAHELVPEKEVAKWVLQGETAQENGIPLGEYIAFRVGLSDVTGKDDAGETVTGLKAQRSMELIEAMGWSDQQEESVWLDVVASDSVGAATKALTDAGVPWDIVNNIVVMQGGKTEKLVAIGEAKLSDQVKVKAMSVYAGDLEKKMLSVGLKYGVKPEWYAEVLKNANADSKGGISQSEAREYILGMGLGLQDMAVLFQMVTDAKEGKSNPFYPSYAELFWYDVHEDDPE